MNNQQFQDPFVAVVVRESYYPPLSISLSCPVLVVFSQIDPNRTISAGRVDIGAFRTYPKDYTPPTSSASEYQSIPLAKIEDFGAHANQYYQLEVEIFKSSLDEELLGLLWNKYWVNTLSGSNLISVRVPFYLSGLSTICLGVCCRIVPMRYRRSQICMRSLRERSRRSVIHGHQYRHSKVKTKRYPTTRYRTPRNSIQSTSSYATFHSTKTRKRKTISSPRPSKTGPYITVSTHLERLTLVTIPFTVRKSLLKHNTASSRRYSRTSSFHRDRVKNRMCHAWQGW